MHIQKATIIFASLIVSLMGFAMDDVADSEKVPKSCIVCFSVVEETTDELCEVCFKAIRKTPPISIKGARFKNVRFDDLPSD